MQHSNHLSDTSNSNKALASSDFQNVRDNLSGERTSQNPQRRRHIQTSEEAVHLLGNSGYGQFPDGGGEEELSSESVDELRERLRRMKNLMANRSKSKNFASKIGRNYSYFVDANVIGYVFGLTLLTILVVSIYAFYNLFWAIWKRNARYHEEL
ncbi:uncharacterized protein LOC109541088 [Dendroctonus ponderosae]|uniref:uncharacterized protein LOC109541088 n=1 Tax=Dendroctonus ponderosae TaxID=77166 RepID=UPI0020363F96|nr:uncharacterized protein LOC109541088 [Dendroctonus ponderosae]